MSERFRLDTYQRTDGTTTFVLSEDKGETYILDNFEAIAQATVAEFNLDPSNVVFVYNLNCPEKLAHNYLLAKLKLVDGNYVDVDFHSIAYEEFVKLTY